MSQVQDLFEYNDYRLFLKSWIRNAKKSGVTNLSRISSKLGIHTTYLSQVLIGIKSLSLDQAIALAELLALTSIEKDYFLILVNIDRAGTLKLKNYWIDKKEYLKKARAAVSSRLGPHHELKDEDRTIFYSNWIYVALFIASDINGRQSLEQLSERFGLSRTKTEEVLSFLLRTGACNYENGYYSLGKTVIHIPNESPFVVKHHINWRLKAMQKMDYRTDAELFFTSPMSMSKDDFNKIKEILSKTIQSSLEICKSSSSEEIVCLNIDFFKVEK